jgi:predicted Zn-ribbon and HTH transcriptional regulator
LRSWLIQGKYFPVAACSIFYRNATYLSETSVKNAENSLKMNTYSQCLNCQSKQIIPDLALQDAGAYPSGSHKVSVEKGAPARLLGKKGGSSLLRAYVCEDCGFTALFAEEPDQLVSH